MIDYFSTYPNIALIASSSGPRRYFVPPLHMPVVFVHAAAFI